MPGTLIALPLLLILETPLGGPAKLDQQRIAKTILAGRDADPALADTIFLDVGLLDASLAWCLPNRVQASLLLRR
jgi:hypothetical protein